MSEEQQGPARAEASDAAQGYDVFVSYSRADRDVVLRLISGLEARSLRPWVDLEDIPPSAEWMSEIQTAIEAADGYLVVVSPDLARSTVCAQELEQAVASGKRIVPIVVRATDPGSVPDPLGGPELDRCRERRPRRAFERGGRGVTDRPVSRQGSHPAPGTGRRMGAQGRNEGPPVAGCRSGEAERVVAASADPRATPLQARFVQASRAAATRRQRGLVGQDRRSPRGRPRPVRGRSRPTESCDRERTDRPVANPGREFPCPGVRGVANMDERLDVGMLRARARIVPDGATPQAMDALHVAAQRSAWIEHTFHHEEGVDALALATSGEMLAQAGADGTVVLRDSPRPERSSANHSKRTATRCMRSRS